MKNFKKIYTGIFCVFFLLLSTWNIYAKPPKATVEKIRVFVSILPQAYFVERIGGDHVHVSVMVGCGQSPATYEPTPRQMVEIAKAQLFFRIGVPFEKVWMDRLSKINPKMKVIDTRRGIKLLPMKTRDNYQKSGLKDPHIWTSIRLVKIQAKNICNALINLNPANKRYYENNLKKFIDDLNRVDAEIVKSLKGIKVRKFMIFHPAWGYFAHDYGLEQIPIEIGGKAPGAMELANLIKEAKKDGIRIIFVQKQFSKKSAQALADAIGGKTIQIDPLARDYLNNMEMIAEAFFRVMR